MQNRPDFQAFFRGKALHCLAALIDLALKEDGTDLTSKAVFTANDRLTAVITAEQDTLVAGLPILSLVLEHIPGEADAHLLVPEGSLVTARTRVARTEGQACKILKAERVVLNFISRLSGIANLTSAYALRLKHTSTILLDTRKTTPGLRYPEKYAVLVGGGQNHRLDLEEMLMLKDNHIDQAGSITGAVRAMRRACTPCPPIEVECRSLRDVQESISAGIDRIMLDNMDPSEMKKALEMTLAAGVESEISGGITLDNIYGMAQLNPTYISVGSLTHSAVAADFSMSIVKA